MKLGSPKDRIRRGVADDVESVTGETCRNVALPNRFDFRVAYVGLEQYRNLSIQDERVTEPKRVDRLA